MSKVSWKGGTMLYPLPAVMVTSEYQGKSNIITIAWTGIINTNPPMTYVSIRKERFSHHLIKGSGVFAINLVPENLSRALDYCGVKSGKDEDKFKVTGLTPARASLTGCPVIKESPLNMECKVTQIMELGSHDMFIAEIVSINVEEHLIDNKGKLHLDKCHLIAYSHGKYYNLGKEIGHFGFSVRKGIKKH